MWSSTSTIPFLFWRDWGLETIKQSPKLSRYWVAAGIHVSNVGIFALNRDTVPLPLNTTHLARWSSGPSSARFSITHSKISLSSEVITFIIYVTYLLYHVLIWISYCNLNGNPDIHNMETQSLHKLPVSIFCVSGKLQSAAVGEGWTLMEGLHKWGGPGIVMRAKRERYWKFTTVMEGSGIFRDAEKWQFSWDMSTEERLLR